MNPIAARILRRHLPGTAANDSDALIIVDDVPAATDVPLIERIRAQLYYIMEVERDGSERSYRWRRKFSLRRLANEAHLKYPHGQGKPVSANIRPSRYRAHRRAGRPRRSDGLKGR